jgi:alcohol dehydrogenase (cytochrome c)
MTNAIAQWPSYNGDPDGDRYSGLRQINRKNADSLRVMCELSLADGDSFETGPVVVGNHLFLTTNNSTFAVDARNCRMIWRTRNSTLENDIASINRGVAFLDGRLFRGTTDGHVIALDASTGSVIWNVTVLDPAKGERFTMAPIAWHGKVFIADAVSDNGIRGRVMAFEAETGTELWRRSTIDAPSWPRGAQTGGGGVWSSFALDKTTAELFVPVSNPAPDFIAAARPGNNSYTNSVLVLDANSGRVKWFYQVTPHDEHDWDLGAAPMLIRVAGRAVVVAASKDGFLYAIDRARHALMYRAALTTMSNATVRLSVKHLHVCPGDTGGVEWNGPTYDHLHDEIVVGAVDWCGTYYQTPGELEGPGGFLGGNYEPDPASTSRGWINAVDAKTGKMRWRHHVGFPVVGGITATAGDVTFAGDTGDEFFVYESASGRLLHEQRLPGAVSGGIVTYSVADKQYVAVATGRTLRTTFSNTGDPTITILSL